MQQIQIDTGTVPVRQTGRRKNRRRKVLIWFGVISAVFVIAGFFLISFLLTDFGYLKRRHLCVDYTLRYGIKSRDIGEFEYLRPADLIGGDPHIYVLKLHETHYSQETGSTNEFYFLIDHETNQILNGHNQNPPLFPPIPPFLTEEFGHFINDSAERSRQQFDNQPKSAAEAMESGKNYYYQPRN